MVTQQVSHRPMKCQPRSWSQRGTKVNGSHHGDSPLLILKPTCIQIATKSIPGPTNREHRKLIGVKTMCLDTNDSFYCLERCQYLGISITSYREDCLIRCTANKVIKCDAKSFYSSSRRVMSYAAFYKQWHGPMSKRFTKPPYSISRATSIDSDCCRLPTASVLSNKADKSRSNPF